MNSVAKTVSYGFLLTVLFCACVRHVPTAPLARPTAESIWDFSTQLDVRLEVDGFSVEDSDWLVSLGSFQRKVDGQITEGPFRINRDQTESWRLLFREVHDSDGQPLELQGYAVETRRFGNGPLLAIQQTEHAAGPGPLVDAFDPLLALLFLLPPEGVGEDPKYRQLAWPFRIDSSRKSHHFSTLKWTKDSTGKDGTGGSLYRYEGQLSGKGKDRSWGTSMGAQGRIEGKIQFDSVGEIQQHTFLVERTLVWGLPADRKLRQVQQLRGEFSTRSGAVVAPWERPFYLTESDVLERLSQASGEWEACSPEPDFVVPLQFVIQRDGSVAVDDEHAQSLQACAQVLLAARFPQHHQTGLRVDTQLVVQEGRFVPYPKASLSKQFNPPAHLLLGFDALGSEAQLRLRSLLAGTGVQQ